MQPLVLSRIPQLYNCIDWSNVDNVPCSRKQKQETQHHLGIKPGSSGSQADPKPLLLLLSQKYTLQSKTITVY